MIYQSEQFSLDTQSFVFERDGKQDRVEPQVFDLLIYLIQNRDRVVTRDELLDNLWSGRIVTESALNARLKAVRKSVGDNGKRQAIIKTFYRRGYQFIGSVTEIKSAEIKALKTETRENSASRPVTVTPSIAVLPFQNMSGEPEQAHFTDGITEDIITALSRVPDLIVISPSSGFTYKGRAVDVRQVGRELAVSHVLEGSIRKIGERLRITAQLVNTHDGDHVWAERYDRKIGDLFKVQDEITHNIVIELQIKLLYGEYSRLVAKGTSNIEAWELATRSVPLTESHLRDEAMLGKRLLLRALELDNNYAVAWSLLGWVYWEEAVWEWGSDPEGSLQLAYEAAQKSLSLDQNFSDAYSLLGHVLMKRGDIQQAISMCERATELAPGDGEAMALLANVLVESGRVKEGNQKIQKAIKLCPFPPPWYLVLMGASYYLEGEHEAAVTPLEQAVERDPESNLGRPWLASSLVEIGRFDDACAVARIVLEIDPAFSMSDWGKLYNASSNARLRNNLLVSGFPE